MSLFAEILPQDPGKWPFKARIRRISATLQTWIAIHNPGLPLIEVRAETRSLSLFASRMHPNSVPGLPA